MNINIKIIFNNFFSPCERHKENFFYSKQIFFSLLFLQGENKFNLFFSLGFLQGENILLNLSNKRYSSGSKKNSKKEQRRLITKLLSFSNSIDSPTLHSQ